MDRTDHESLYNGNHVRSSKPLGSTNILNNLSRMKTTFARIIELERYQVLLTKEFNEKTESPQIQASFEVDGIRVSTAFGYDSEDEANKCFEIFGIEEAQILIEGFMSWKGQVENDEEK